MDDLLGTDQHWRYRDEAEEVAVAVAEAAWQESRIVGQDSVTPRCDLAEDLPPNQRMSD